MVHHQFIMAALLLLCCAANNERSPFERKEDGSGKLESYNYSFHSYENKLQESFYKAPTGASCVELTKSGWNGKHDSQSSCNDLGKMVEESPGIRNNLESVCVVMKENSLNACSDTDH